MKSELCTTAYTTTTSTITNAIDTVATVTIVITRSAGQSSDGQLHRMINIPNGQNPNRPNRSKFWPFRVTTIQDFDVPVNATTTTTTTTTNIGTITTLTTITTVTYTKTITTTKTVTITVTTSIISLAEKLEQAIILNQRRKKYGSQNLRLPVSPFFKLTMQDNRLLLLLNPFDFRVRSKNINPGYIVQARHEEATEYELH
ncbi:uncharacterized protein LOC124304831 [Neodiprion virginianus]|uniref:uncharacterized protein LOC124304831 n=1 Tax=Neodiprion virginianus TaxID=2961670 RepID=UPI001EE6B892|nr:uncharacterized protein LOC124304831 [Neodiprion virginianus]